MHEAAADSLAGTTAALAAPAIAEIVEHWHEYYLMAGTAAVTLVGLLFVALSFHLDALLKDEKAHLLAAARLAFMNFIFVMLIALAFLAPGLRPKLLDTTLLAVSILLLGNTVWGVLRHRGGGSVWGQDQFLRRRYLASGAIAGFAIMSAIRFLVEPRPTWFFNFAFVCALMLVNAAGIAWDLLVQVGRQKLAQERAEHR